MVGAENLQSGEPEKLHERTGVGAGRSIATSVSRARA
jgi:hypothetical protein